MVADKNLSEIIISQYATKYQFTKNNKFQHNVLVLQAIKHKAKKSRH